MFNIISNFTEIITNLNQLKQMKMSLDCTWGVAEPRW